jgi:hypothetical protein
MPNALRTVRDVMDPKVPGQVLWDWQLIPKCDSELTEHAYRGLQLAIRDSPVHGFLVGYSDRDNTTWTLTVRHRQIRPELSSVVSPSVPNTFKATCRAIEQHDLLTADDNELPIPYDCIDSTAKWWARLQKSNADLLDWQFRYTVHAVLCRDRLSAIRQTVTKSATRPAAQCRLCNGAGESYEHLFVTCPVAADKRTEWARPLRKFKLKPTDVVDLWCGRIREWVWDHWATPQLLSAATKAIEHRKKLFNT